MPNRRPHDHIGNFRIVVELEGLKAVKFGRVEGMDSETEVIELRAGALAGEGLAAWRQAFHAGSAVRRSGSITRYGSAGLEQERYRLFGAFPSKFTEGMGPGPSNIQLVEIKATRVLRAPPEA